MARRRKVPMIPVAVEPQIFPEAVRWWVDSVAKYEKKSLKVREEARKHMSAMGWKFWHAKLKGDKPVEFRYQSPAGKLYYSLKTACKACVELDDNLNGFESTGSNGSDPNSPMEKCKEPKSWTTCTPKTMPKKRGRKKKKKKKKKKKIDLAVLNMRGRKRKIDLVMPEESSGFLMSDATDPNYHPMEDCNKEAKSCGSSPQLKPKKRGRKKKIELVMPEEENHKCNDLLTADDIDPDYHPMEDCKEAKSCTSSPQSKPKKRGRKRKIDLVMPDLLTSDDSDPNYHPMEDCKESRYCTSSPQSRPKKRRIKKKIDLVTPEAEQGSLEISHKPGGKDVAELKRLRFDEHPKLQIRSPRTILSSLIDNKIVKLNARVYYRARKHGDAPLAWGQVSREGIVCDCCAKVFALTAFEAHAGSTNHRPGANIILEEDGRAISDCQLQMKSSEKVVIKKNSKASDKIDDLCSVSHNEGELILCDRCPSSFHASCLGLTQVADGDWFCPACCCGICGSGKLEQGLTIPDDIRKCDQCEHKYHVRCLSNNEVVCEQNWFCSSRCQNIQVVLKRLLGQPILVGDNNLTWTLWKSTSDNTSDSRETQKKLRSALNVLHACFQPSVDPYTQRDLVKDIVFNRESNLRRLNFRGFYTVVLERKKQVICVATVRVYGEVAEVPLVATMHDHRRLGMCRILMNQLEKQLTKLGVERLVLPSAPAALDTWTNTSIGFSQMPAAEKPQFINYFFLYFQGTILCHKFLKQRIAATQATSPEETMELDDSSGGVSIITKAEES